MAGTTTKAGYLLPSSTPGTGAMPTVQPSATNGLDWRMPTGAASAEIRFGACYGDGNNANTSWFAAPSVVEVDPAELRQTQAGGNWVTPTFAGSWANYGSGYNPAGYFKDSDGFVHLRGLVRNGTGNIFTLPAGFRPSYRGLYAVQTSPNTIGRVDVTSAGVVTMVAGNNGWISLDTISFRAD